MKSAGNTFESSWWSVELPPKWYGNSEEQCARFQTDPPIGILQISAAKKDADTVTDEDLREFALQRLSAAATLEDVCFRSFSGFTAKYDKSRISWQEWWLKSGNLMLYATYNVRCGMESAELRAITAILNSLRNKLFG